MDIRSKTALFPLYGFILVSVFAGSASAGKAVGKMGQLNQQIEETKKDINQASQAAAQILKSIEGYDLEEQANQDMLTRMRRLPEFQSHAEEFRAIESSHSDHVKFYEEKRAALNQDAQTLKDRLRIQQQEIAKLSGSSDRYISKFFKYLQLKQGERFIKKSQDKLLQKIKTLEADEQKTTANTLTRMKDKVASLSGIANELPGPNNPEYARFLGFAESRRFIDYQLKQIEHLRQEIESSDVPYKKVLESLGKSDEYPWELKDFADLKSEAEVMRSQYRDPTIELLKDIEVKEKELTTLKADLTKNEKTGWWEWLFGINPKRKIRVEEIKQAILSGERDINNWQYWIEIQDKAYKNDLSFLQSRIQERQAAVKQIVADIPKTTYDNLFKSLQLSAEEINAILHKKRPCRTDSQRAQLAGPALLLMLAAKNITDSNHPALSTLATYLKAHPEMADEPDQNGFTALQHAVQQKNLVMVDFLCTYGANPFAKGASSEVSEFDKLLSQGGHGEDTYVAQMLVSMLKADKTQNQGSYDEVLSSASEGSAVAAFLPTLLKQGPPAFTKRYKTAVTAARAGGRLSALKNLGYVNSQQPSWWKDSVGSVSSPLQDGTPEAKEVGELLDPSLSAEEARTRTGLVVLSLIRALGEGGSGRWISPPYDPRNIQGLIGKIVADPSRIDFKETDGDGTIAEAAIKLSQVPVVQQLIQNGVPFPPRSKLLALEGKDTTGQMVKEVFGSSQYSGPEGDFIDVRNADGTTTRKNVLLWSSPNFLTDPTTDYNKFKALFDTRRKVTLPSAEELLQLKDPEFNWFWMKLLSHAKRADRGEVKDLITHKLLRSRMKSAVKPGVGLILNWMRARSQTHPEVMEFAEPVAEAGL